MALHFLDRCPLINAIVADVSDKLNLERGENISGTVFSYLTTFTKVGFALGCCYTLFSLRDVLGF
jgi:Na+/melibiose symporter-like transporter